MQFKVIPLSDGSFDHPTGSIDDKLREHVPFHPNLQQLLGILQPHRRAQWIRRCLVYCEFRERNFVAERSLSEMKRDLHSPVARKRERARGRVGVRPAVTIHLNVGEGRRDIAGEGSIGRTLDPRRGV